MLKESFQMFILYLDWLTKCFLDINFVKNSLFIVDDGGCWNETSDEDDEDEMEEPEKKNGSVLKRVYNINRSCCSFQHRVH